MAIFLIDYENTHSLNGINNLSETDKVIVFYSNNANTLTFSALESILCGKASITCKAVEVGTKNALDFQLSTYLGYLLKETEGTDTKIFIVSKDLGFSLVKSFWLKELNVDIEILPCISGEEENNTEISLGSSKQKQKKKSKEKQSKASELEKINLQTQLSSLSLGLTQTQIQEIVSLVESGKTKQVLNSELNSLLKDSKKSGKILKIIKSISKK